MKGVHPECRPRSYDERLQIHLFMTTPNHDPKTVITTVTHRPIRHLSQVAVETRDGEQRGESPPVFQCYGQLVYMLWLFHPQQHVHDICRVLWSELRWGPSPKHEGSAKWGQGNGGQRSGVRVVGGQGSAGQVRVVQVRGQCNGDQDNGSQGNAGQG